MIMTMIMTSEAFSLFFSFSRLVLTTTPSFCWRRLFAGRMRGRAHDAHLLTTANPQRQSASDETNEPETRKLGTSIDVDFRAGRSRTSCALARLLGFIDRWARSGIDPYFSHETYVNDSTGLTSWTQSWWLVDRKKIRLTDDGTYVMTHTR